MSFSDWIGLLQTVVLAVAAWAAFAGLRLTTRENARLRTEQRLQPRRELLLDVVRELKELAAQVEVVLAGVGYFDTSAPPRGSIGCASLSSSSHPANCRGRRRPADPHDLTQSTAQAAVQPAAAELAAELHRLEKPVYTD